MIGTKKTVKDYMELPEGAPYQLIEGELVMSPAPGYSHQNTLGNLFIILRTRLKDAQVILSPIDVYLDEENAYQPDLVVVLKDSKAKVEERGIFGAPDVVVEILSPSTAYYDLTEKKDVYERVGVKEYWIVDPKRKTFEIYSNSEEGFKLTSQAKKDGKVRSELLGLEIDLKELFEEV
ncbi:Uma2 family endonuclease [Thermocrinis jamiesonii]|uniref:Uma2 family endonuclease n=1 Tax=Thermocrinis jamiesonii TaxID=1302351 RepID=UPI00049683C7|nr:Uma2 family endonuclease [Thermocrinis jamiesonii]